VLLHFSHDSMVCLTGTRVESRIVSPGHHSKPGRTTTLTQRKTTPFDANSSPTEAKCEDELPVAKSPAAGTYVRIPPVDNYVSTSNGATTFHTFHPTTHSRSSNSDKNSSKFLHWLPYIIHVALEFGAVSAHATKSLFSANNQSSVSKINQAVTQMPSKG